MKFITPNLHAIIDYLAAVFLALCPMLFDLDQPFATAAYVLAGIHLTMTLLTDFQYGAVRVIPYKVHGYIEVVVSLSLLAAPWLFGFSDNETARNLSVAFGITVMLIFLLTNWQANPHAGRNAVV